MQSFGRTFAAILFLLLLPSAPATAAPDPAPTAEPYLGRVTLAPAGPEKDTLLRVRASNVVAGQLERLEMTVDLDAATAFADVALTGILVTGGEPPAVLDSDEEEPCRRTGGKVFCSWNATFTSAGMLDVPVVLSVTPKKTAKEGDSAAVTVTAKLGDGPVGTSTSEFRVGQGVDLVAGEDRQLKAAPGRAVMFAPTVHNQGSAVVTGVALVVDADPRLLGKTSYRNCRYGTGLICTFDTALAANTSYAPAKSLTLSSPADTVPGSLTQITYAWITRTEFDESPLDGYGTPGTGAPLTLQALAAAQDDQPQADVRPDNSHSFLTFTVTGKRRPAIAAAGLRRTAAVGDRLTLSPGFTNFGPGTLRPSLFPNNRLVVTMRLPSNVTRNSAPELCFPDEAPEVLLCLLRDDVGAGQRTTFPIGMEVTAQCGDPGQIEIPVRLADADGNVPPARSIATLTVDVAGAPCVALPITGPPVGWTALTGLLLLVAGTVLTVLGVRRPFCEHAGGASGPDRDRKDAS
ncbi:hypothetical protein Aab01nite_55530 [Paractinoplanes abujensis]|uniref:Uncharacterized protein n=1 Tax=Paractinoplanes abujensis TaxID=882441 RepID=A0A7W7CZN8_9ACTN|nr:hypothetical protein [Actinoplanes abujensis]MBB4695976.1 hypothetical protein [Actinoplanes abujensis]GID21963.1 hypothetical protein Aab01nite_55530 [Actinoplanes abujensis]